MFEMPSFPDQVIGTAGKSLVDLGQSLQKFPGASFKDAGRAIELVGQGLSNEKAVFDNLGNPVGLANDMARDLAAGMIVGEIISGLLYAARFAATAEELAAIALLAPALGPVAMIALAAAGLYGGYLLETYFSDWLKGGLNDLLQYFLSDPLVLDLDGDGLELISLASSVTQFDIDNDGILERIGWTEPHDGLLAYDANHNGIVDGVGELFGSAHVDGFDDLAVLDANLDNKIDQLDPAFADLRAWRDVNGDGVSTPDELLTMAQAGIASIGVTYTLSGIEIGGNKIARVGSFTRVDGEHRAVGSVWFGMDESGHRPTIPEGTNLKELLALPNLSGAEALPDLRTAMFLDPTLQGMVEDLINSPHNFHTFKDFISGGFRDVLYRWAGVDQSAPEQTVESLHTAVIEAFTGRRLEDLNDHQKNRIAEVWDSLLGLLGTQFLIQASHNASSKPWLEIASEINALDVTAPDFVDSLDQVVAAVAAQATAATPAYDYLKLFTSLQLDITTGAIAGDFDAFAREFVKSQPSFSVSSWVYGSGRIPKSMNSDGSTLTPDEQQEDAENVPAEYIHPWTKWFNDQGKTLFFIAQAMGLGSDYVMNVTGWNWLLNSAVDVEGTNTNDFLSEGLSTYTDSILMASPGGGLAWVSQTHATLDQRLYGFEGNDELRGNDGVDRLAGGAGNDWLLGGSGSDMYLFSAGDGLDRITEESGDDDTIYFSSELSSENLRVERYGSTNDLLLHFGDTAEGIILTNQINMGGSGIEHFSFVGQRPISAGEIATIYLTAFSSIANDIVTGTRAGETIHGLSGNDTLDGWDGDDHLYGDLDDDSLSGGGGNDVIEGGAGNDLIYPGNGNDTVIGGAGNDSIWESDGDDTYIWNLGDGDDVLRDGFWWDGINTIQFGAGITAEDLVVTRVGGDMKLTIRDQPGSFTIEAGFHKNVDDQVDQILFADGTTLTRAQFFDLAIKGQQSSGADEIVGTRINDVIEGGAGNDLIYPGNGNDTVIGGAGNDSIWESDGDDTYIWNLGDGDDVLRDGFWWDGINTIQFGAGITAEDLVVTRVGGDMKLTIRDQPGSFTIEAGFHKNVDDQVDQILFADGTTLTRAQFFDLAIKGQQSSGADEIVGTRINDVIEGGAGNDLIYPGNGNDTVIGGAGNDSIWESDGDDTYIWNLGDGDDVLRDGFWWDGINTIQFGAGITAEDLVVTRVGGDMKLTIRDQPGSFTIEAGFHKNVDDQVDQILFADGTTLTRAQFFDLAIKGQQSSGADEIVGTRINDVIEGGAGNDLILETDGDDAYVWNEGDGDDVIRNFGVWDGTNTLLLGPGITPNETRITATGINSDGILVSFVTHPGSIKLEGQRYSGEGVDQILFADGSVLDRSAFLAKLNANNDLFGTSGEDGLAGSDGDDLLNGGKGSDILEGRKGSDIYIYASGDGDDQIYDQNSGTPDSDILQLVDLNPDDVALRRQGESLVIQDITTGQEIEVLQHFGISGQSMIENIYFADGTVWDNARIQEEAPINGTPGDEVLWGGAGNDSFKSHAGTDIMIGGAGNDTYYYSIGDGSDGASDWNGQGYSNFGFDVVRLGAGITPSDTVVKQDGYDVVLQMGTENSQLRLYNELNGDPRALIEQVIFADGTIWSSTAIADKAVIIGTPSDEVLWGNELNNRFRSSTGSDAMIGGAGDDTYYFSRGDGTDAASDWNGQGYSNFGFDTVQFGTGIAANEVFVTREGNDAIFHIGETADSIRLYNQFNGDPRAAIEQVIFADGTTWDYTSYLSRVISPTASDDVIVGAAGADVLYGLGGNDLLEGGAGADTISGGQGDDILDGGAGGDTLDGGAGIDAAIYGGLQASYSITTSAGTVMILDNDPNTDGDDGTDTLTAIEVAQFRDGAQLNLVSPIVLDLDGDGVRMVSSSESKVDFDWDGDGVRNRTGWIGNGDGLLVYDRDHDGTVSSASELSFIDDKLGGKSDLDGLSAFDSSGDGSFSAEDTAWDNFHVWRDRNQDGKVDQGELVSMSGAGVASIGLTGTATEKSWGWDDNIIINDGHYTRLDGTTFSFADVAISYINTSTSDGVLKTRLHAQQLVEASAQFGSTGAFEGAIGKYDSAVTHGFLLESKRPEAS